MNHVYRLKRSGRTQQLQPVPETARAAGKGTRTGKTLAQAVTATLASVALGGMASLAHAQQAPPAVSQLPQGGVVTRGSANINTNVTPAGNALMTVNQASNRAVIDWASFNVGSQAKVQFNQPGSSAVTLNNILGNNASQIYGQISANGQVFLSNPNGVYFSPTAQVSVGGLVATTGKANADDFMAGKTTFNRGGSTASVVNEGQLKAAAGGYIALLAPEVRNQGVVVAQAGTVALASGEAITLSFNTTGTGLAGITTTPQAIAALVENRSAVLAEGGQIILSAHALASLQGSVVNNSGQLSASSLTEKGGKIVLMADQIALSSTSRIDANGPQGGGTVLVGGDWQGTGDTRQATQVTMAQGASIEANATQQGDGGKVVLWSDVKNANSLTQVEGRIEAKGAGTGPGGQVETSGHSLKVGDATRVSTLSQQGSSGQWLLDPNDFTVAATGGDITGAALSINLGSGSVTITSDSGAAVSTTSGSIFINDSINWSANTLTLTAQNNVTVNKVMNLTGTAGLSVRYGQNALAAATTGRFTANAPINIASTGSFSTKLGSDGALTSYTIVNSLGAAADATSAPAAATLQGMAASANLATNFVLGSDIDASSTAVWNSNNGFNPIGSTTAFSGKFNGLGHTIIGLSEAATTSDYLGMFGNTTGSVSNLNLANVSISGRNYVGAVAGTGSDFYNIRTLGGTVTGTTYVGGIAGSASAPVDTVTNSANVTGRDSSASAAQFIGGVLGKGSGAINNATNSGTVTVSNTDTALVTGASTALQISAVGGLVGHLAANATMTLANNTNTGDVTVSTAATTCGNSYCIADVGGLYGLLGGSSTANASWRVTLSDSSNTGAISVASTTAASMSSHTTKIARYTGGLLGRADKYAANGFAFTGGLTLTNLWSTGSVSGYSAVGGLVGMTALTSTATAALSNVFSNLWVSGNITAYGNTGLLGGGSGYSPYLNNMGVGGLIGNNLGDRAGWIKDSHYSGSMVSLGGGQFGGLVGVNYGPVTNAYATGSISLASSSLASPGSNVVGEFGGLVGYQSGVSGNAAITNSYSDVAINLGSGAAVNVNGVGGLVGWLKPVAGSEVAINSSYALGDIQLNLKAISLNSYNVGGLVGMAATPASLSVTANVSGNTLNITSTSSAYLAVGTSVTGPGILPGSYITGQTTGAAGGTGSYTLNQVQTSPLSGQALYAYPSGYINNSYASGNVSASNANSTGGLAGQAASIYNSYASGNVSGGSASTVGGLVGQGQQVYNSYALGNVTGGSYSGGLVGQTVNNSYLIDGIAKSYWSGQTVVGGTYTGALLGGGYANINDSYASGAGQVSGISNVGGLVGFSGGDIVNSFSTVSVTGTGNGVGGLVGTLGTVSHLSKLSGSWASGTVNATSAVGGLVGISYGAISDAYAIGAVSASSFNGQQGAGGLVGTNLGGGSVNNSFATGNVSFSYAGNNAGTQLYGGGLIGYNAASGSINNSYATGNVTLSNFGSAGGLIGLTAIPTVSTTAVGSLTPGNNPANTTNLQLTTAVTIGGVAGVGASVTGAGIPVGTTITALGANGTSYTVSQPLNITSSINVTFSNPTASSAASISGNTLTLGGTVTGYFAPGTAISGSGIPAGTIITGVQNLSNTLANGFGGAGSTYTLNNSVTVSTAVTGTNMAVGINAKLPESGFLSMNSLSGGFAVGMTVTGPGIPAGTTITGTASRLIANLPVSGYTLSNSTAVVTTPFAVTGQLATPNISNVYATGNVYGNSTYNSTNYSYLGGLVGQVASLVSTGIENGYASGSVPLTAKVSSAVNNSNQVVLLAPNAGSGVAVGAKVSGDGIPAGTTVIAIVSGTGGAGTYRLSNNVTLSAGQYLGFSSATMGTALRGGLVGFVGTGNSSASNNGAGVPALNNLFFNSDVNSGLYGVGNDGVSNTGLSSGTLARTAVQLRTVNDLPGLNFTTTTLGNAATGLGSAGNRWVLVDEVGTFNNASGATGATTPMLASEYSTTISSPHQLQLMQLNPAAAYVQQNSLKFGSSDVWGSAGFVPVGPFSGSYTGSALASSNAIICPPTAGGCIITDLRINSSQNTPVGLFSSVTSSGSVSGVRLLNASVTGAGSVGVVVGSNAGTLSFSMSNGSVTSTSAGANGVGGVAGENSGTMERVFSTATVTGSAGSSMLAGGVVGINQSGATLTNAYAASTGAITSSGLAGGIAGSNAGSISKTFAAGPVAGAGTVSGGLVGTNAGGSLSTSFWDTTTTGQSAPIAMPVTPGPTGTVSGNAGMSTANMQTLANYTSATSANGNSNPGWNYTTVWNPPTVAGALYPALRDFLIPITVTAKAVSKVYDGQAYSGPVKLSYSLPNVLLSGTAGYEDSILNYLNVGSYNIMPAGLYSNQYNILFAGGTLTVTKRPLTFTVNSQTAKVYDGTTTLDASNIGISGLVGSQTLAITSANAVSALVSANTSNYISSITLGDATDNSGGLLANYSAPTTLTRANAPVTITAKPLTLSGATVSDKVYDATPTASISGGSLTGVVAIDVGRVSLSSTGTFASANVGNGVAVSGALTGSAASNYSLTPSSLSGNITAKPLTLTGVSVTDKVYDATTTASLTGGSLVGVVPADASRVSLSTTGTFASANAANGIAVSGALTGLAAGNYSLSSTGLTGNITAKPVTVTNTSRTTTYDGTSTYGTLASGTAFITSALVGSDSVASVTQTPSGAGVTASGIAQAGSFTVTPSNAVMGTGTASNYSFSYVDSTHTVNQAVVTLISGALQGSVSKVYDGSNTATLTSANYALTGWLNSDGATVTKTSGTYDNANAGSGKTVTVSLTNADYAATGSTNLSNYTLPSSISGAVGVITAKPVTVTNTARSTTYDGTSTYGALASGTAFTASALVGSDNVASVTQTPSGTGVTGSGVAQAGSFTVTPSSAVMGTGSASNYSFSYVDSTHTVSPAQVTVTSITGALQGSVSKVYDGNSTATLTSANYALTGWLNSDSATVTKTSGTYDNANAGSGKTVTVSLTNADYAATGSTNLSNYTLPSSISGAVGVITAKPVTVTNTARSTTYDGTSTYGVLASGTAFTASALVGSDSVASVTQTASGTGVTSAGVAQAGSFTVTPSNAVLGTGVASNYSFSYVDSTHTVNPVIVTPAPVSLTSINGTLQGLVSKVYDGNNTATLTSANYALTGWLGNDGATVTKTSGTYDNANAGSGKTVTVSVTNADYAATGSTNLGNYTLPTSISGAVGMITAKPVTVTSTARSTTYDGTSTYGALASGTAFTTSALVGSDRVASVTQTASGTGVSGSGIAQAGSFTVTPGNAVLGTGAASNYSFTYVPGTLTVNPVAVSASLVGSGLQGSVSKVYDGSNVATLSPVNYVLTGWLGTDGATVTKTIGTYDNASEGSGKTVTVSVTHADYLATGSTQLSNYALPSSISGTVGEITAKPVTVTNPSGTTPKPEVLSPALPSKAAPYQVTVLKLPKASQAGVVHIALNDSLSDVQIALPDELQQWIKSAATGLTLEGDADQGMTLDSTGAALNVASLAERRWPLNVVLRAGQESLAIRMVKAK